MQENTFAADRTEKSSFTLAQRPVNRNRGGLSDLSPLLPARRTKLAMPPLRVTRTCGHSPQEQLPARHVSENQVVPSRLLVPRGPRRKCFTRLMNRPPRSVPDTSPNAISRGSRHSSGPEPLSPSCRPQCSFVVRPPRERSGAWPVESPAPFLPGRMLVARSTVEATIRHFMSWDRSKTFPPFASILFEPNDGGGDKPSSNCRTVAGHARQGDPVQRIQGTALDKWAVVGVDAGVPGRPLGGRGWTCSHGASLRS